MAKSRRITIRDYLVKSFGGLVTRVEDFALRPQDFSDSNNWLFFGDHVELTRGAEFMGTEQVGAGRISGLRTLSHLDGSQLLTRTRAQKIEYWSPSSEDWVEVGTDILPAAVLDDDGICEDIAIEPYHSLAGAIGYFASPNTGWIKMMVANPGSAEDQGVTNHRGYIRIKQNRSMLFDRSDTNGGRDRTGLYGSKIDKDELSDYTAVANENKGVSGSTNYTGNLTDITSVRTALFVSFDATVAAGTETFHDNRDGTLTSNFGGTGTINYTTGAFNITFSAVTTGSVFADYYWENATSGGILDFSFSPTRLAGEGFVFRQDAGGGPFFGIGGLAGREFCFHERKAWNLTLGQDDTEATNLEYRGKVGIPSRRAYCETGEGVYFLNTSDPSSPFLEILSFASGSTEIVPLKLSETLDLTDYRFDDCALFVWDLYVVIACRHKDYDYNQTMFVYNKLWKSWAKVSFRGSVLDEFDGSLIAGDSFTNNVYKLFSGWTIDDAAIPNHLITGRINHGVEGVKDSRLFVVAGLIVSDQEFDISMSADNGNFTLLKTIEGDGSYVDSGVNVTIGANMVGSQEIGGGGSGVNAHPFRYEFNISQITRYEYCKIKLEAMGIGYLSITEFGLKDNRYKGKHLPAKYRTLPGA